MNKFLKDIIKGICMAVLAGMLVTACNVTRKLPPGEKLYTGAEIKVKDGKLTKKQEKAIRSEMKSLVRPKPNKSILGIRFKLWVYQRVKEPKKESGLRYWLKYKIGEAPVLASSVNLQNTALLLQNRLENQGYFKAAVAGDTTAKNKLVKATYTVTPSVQYTIRRVVFPTDSLVVLRTISEVKDRSLLKPGDPFNLDVIKAERERIDGHMKETGYYFFNPDHLLIRTDSTVGNNQVDMFVIIKPNAPDKALEKYYINDIVIYPNYAIGQDTLLNSATATRYKDFLIVDPQKNFKPKVFERTMFFNKCDYYNRTDHNMSLNRLVNVGTFKFVKNRFEEVPGPDSPMLNVYYYLTPLKRKSIRIETIGKTNSANFMGTELNVNWRHRNLFRGSELLTFKVTGGFDLQMSGQNKGYNIFRAGAEANLVFPRFVPFNFKGGSAFVPRTKLTLAYDWQQRQKLYTLNTFRTSFGYAWKENIRKDHTLDILSVTYVNNSSVTQEYMDQVKLDSSLARVIEEQLVMGPAYSFTYSNTMLPDRTHGFYYNGKVDVSATVLGLAQGANVKDGKQKTLFDVPYSQYFKTEHDVRYYLKVSNGVQWANRLFVGLGIPYGNSSELPFVKQFFIGGSNSLRAFRVRSLGPGTYRPVVSPSSFLPDQTGDVKLEINTELRAKLVSVVHGAIFMDAGNIWLFNENKMKPGAKFSSDFMKELAVGGGVGIRLDFSILLLRLDFAIPFRKPWLPDGSRWVFNQIDFGSQAWRKENFVFNLAIGLPF